MVDWVNSVIPDHQIINFTTDWLDGLSLSYLVKAFCSANMPDEETLEKQSPIERVTVAMEIAEMELNITCPLRPTHFINKSVDQLQRMAYITQFLKFERRSRSQVTSLANRHNSAEEETAVKNGLSNGESNQVDAPTEIETIYDNEKKEEERELPSTTESNCESDDSFESEPKFNTARKPSKEAREREIEVEREMEVHRANRDKRKSNLDDLFAAVENDFDSFLKQIDNIGDKKNEKIKSTATEVQKEVVNPSTAQKEEILELDFDFEFSSDTVTSSDVLSRPQSISPDPAIFWPQDLDEGRVEEQIERDDNDATLQSAMEQVEMDDNDETLQSAMEQVERDDNDEPLQSAMEQVERGDNDERLQSAMEQVERDDNDEPLQSAMEQVERGDNDEPLQSAMEQVERGDNDEPLQSAAVMMNNTEEKPIVQENNEVLEEEIKANKVEDIHDKIEKKDIEGSHSEEQESVNVKNEMIESENDDDIEILTNDHPRDSNMEDDQLTNDNTDQQQTEEDVSTDTHDGQTTPQEITSEEETISQRQADIEPISSLNDSIVMSSQMSTTTSPEPVSDHSSTPPSPSPSASPAPSHDQNTEEQVRPKLQSEYSPLSNPQRCKVSGRGLYYGIVNQQGDFVVDCSEAGRGRLEIVIESPTGENLEADGEQIKESVFRLHFTPTEIGTHKISVLFHNTNVPNSPFSCDVCDPSACTTTGLEQTQCIVGKDERFQVNTRYAGPGTLQTSFNGTDQPTDFQLTSCIEGTFTYHYTVPKTGEYEVDVKWVGQRIPGSPFKIVAKEDRPNSKACIILEQPLENVRVRDEIRIRVDCQNAGKGELKTLLRSPKSDVACQVVNENGFYTVTTRPSVVGDHLLVLQYGGDDIPDSPIKIHVNDPTLVKLNVKPNVTQSVSVNKAFTLHASTEKCGEGHLSALATTSEAPNRPIDLNIEPDSTGYEYTMFYTPKSLGIHSIQVLYDNKPCLATPINLKVYDVNSIQDIVLTKTLPAQGTQHLLNKLLSFQLSAPNRDPADISFSAIGVRTGQTPQLSMIPTIDHSYSLEFRALKPDDYKITVTYKGEHIQGSPFTIPVCLPVRANKVTMYDPVIPLSASKPIELVFDTSQAGQGILTASVLNSKKKNMPVYVEQVNDEIYRVAFIPKESSTFMVTVLYAERHIGGSPFRVLYQEQSKQPLVSIDFQPDMSIKGLMGSAIYGRNSGRQEATVVQYERGKYQISFQPQSADTFDLHVYWFDTEIEGSPFEIDLLGMENESSDALVDSVPVAMGNKVGMLAATTVGHNSGPVPIKLTPVENCLCNIEFTSPGKDNFDLNVYWNGKPLPGMPIVLPLD